MSTYKWACPQCRRTFKVRSDRPAPGLCPDCEKTPAPVQPAFPVPSTPVWSRRKFHRAKQLVIGTLVFFGVVLIGVSIYLSVGFARSEIQAEFKAGLIVLSLMAGIVPATLFFAQAAMLMLLIQIERNTKG